MSETLTCSKCGQDHPARDFYWVTSNLNGKAYRRTVCRTCTVARAAERQRLNPRPRRKSFDTMTPNYILPTERLSSQVATMPPKAQRLVMSAFAVADASLRQAVRIAKQLSDGPTSQEPPADVVGKVVAAAADVMGVPVSHVTDRNRKRDVVEARRLAGVYLHRNLGMPYSRIGKLFKRDHSSIINLSQGHDALISVDRNYQKLYDQFLAHVENILSQPVGNQQKAA